MSNHKRLKELGLTPTADVEAAYAAGKGDGERPLLEALRVANERLSRVERTLIEIKLLSGRIR